MRKINKQIIILSIVLASVFVSSQGVSANSVSSGARKGYLNKNHSLMQVNKTAIENSLKNHDYNLFINTLYGLGINESITNNQFDILVSAYNLFKANKNSEAVKLLQDNNVNPVLIKFINNRPELTDDQKNILKNAYDLIKQGKIEDGKEMLKTAGLSDIPMKMDKKINQIELKAKKEEVRKVFNQVRELKKAGKFDEAKKILKDADIPDFVKDGVYAEEKPVDTVKTGLFNSFKNLFIK